ncbi:hypothetical protein O1611_g1538 [Lasiodiplodia mahajangana]|uniref:Uncharacterized protein n=1 Tax=Lasiodiplodia mahajangana TaxID=1108764 RepID=A0ACC2JX41_9PEZI|nr:hypothetical protein O1611_g1538 [Lasiodiplodia mahajangana]
MVQSATPCRWALLGLSSIAQTFVDNILLTRDSSDPISHIATSVSTTGGKERAQKWLAERKAPRRQMIVVRQIAQDDAHGPDIDRVVALL